jgi:hypothetical protein
MPIRLQRARALTLPTPLEQIELAWLRRLFERAVRGSVLGSLALTGCAGDDAASAEGGDGGARPPMTATLRCDGTDWELASGFALERDVDYVADRNADGDVLSEVGEPCASADDRAQCLSAYELGMSNLVGRHLLTTESDIVRLWQNPAVLMLFGEIDTPHEALWLVSTSDYATPCAETHVLPTARGFEVRKAHRGDETCPTGDRATATVLVTADGTLDELSFVELPDQGCVVPGRRPEGLRSMHRARGASRLGDHFAAMAHMEAASVPAFAAIARELAHHRAPLALRAQAERARRDELRHARIATQLARRFGARPTEPVVERRPLRALEAFALDNAVEGCVNETYAALEASHQAVQARDGTIARAMGAIAADETRHAALSWQIHAWVMPRLPARAQRRVSAAQRTAAERLGDRVERCAHPLLRAAAGLPDAQAARTLHASLARDLWRV